MTAPRFSRALAEDVLRAVIARCDPAALVADAIDGPYPEKAAACLADEHAVSARLAGRAVVGVALGKAALAMARGAGPVARGIAVYPAPSPGAPLTAPSPGAPLTAPSPGAPLIAPSPGAPLTAPSPGAPLVATSPGAAAAAAAAEPPPLPPGWRAIASSHPTPDERSLAAGLAIRALVESARPDEAVLALVSGGASALVEQPMGDDPAAALAALVAEIRALAAAGAPIAELNRARTARSQLKGGKLARLSAAPVTTLVISDVVGDALDLVGSGPTIPCDHAVLVAPLAAAARAAAAELRTRGVRVAELAAPLTGDVTEVAASLRLPGGRGILVAFGEPTVRLPANPGVGGRAQQLALLLARRLRGTQLGALVVGTDGIDGNSRAAGAFVDGTTWDRIADPEAALARADAGSVLGDALVVTGPTGINHADLVLVGSLV